MGLRIGVLGLNHDHVWDHLPQLAAAAADGQLTLVGAADPHQPLRERAAREFGCPVTADWGSLLDADLDAVAIFTDNRTGAELATEAARRGLHVLIEKPMAHTLAAADQMLAAARHAQVQLLVNWPFAWWPQLQHALQLAASGTIGRVWQVKYRAAHAGPRELGCSEYFCDWLFDASRNGGGALIDYCCYGALLARAVLGVPSRVTAVSGRLTKETLVVEDNAVLVMTYPGAMAVSEGSWSEIGKLSSYQTVIYGTEGTLLVEPRAGGRLLLATAQREAGEAVEVPVPPADRLSATAHLLAVVGGDPIHPLCDPRISRDAQEILQAGLLAVQSGEQISLPLSLT